MLRTPRITVFAHAQATIRRNTRHARHSSHTSRMQTLPKHYANATHTTPRTSRAHTTASGQQDSSQHLRNKHALIDATEVKDSDEPKRLPGLAHPPLLHTATLLPVGNGPREAPPAPTKTPGTLGFPVGSPGPLSPLGFLDRERE